MQSTGTNSKSTQSVYNEIVKFVVVGSINTGIDALVLNLLSHFTGAWKGAGIFGLNSISYGVALINSYFLNRYWTFLYQSKKRKILNFTAFVVVNAIGLVLNSLIVTAVTTFIHPCFNLDQTAWLNVAKLLVATPLVMIFNFLSYKYFVFRTPK